MSNKTQLQTNNTTLDALITRVNAAKDTAASLPEAGGSGEVETCVVKISVGLPSVSVYYVSISGTMQEVTGGLSSPIGDLNIPKNSIIVVPGAVYVLNGDVTVTELTGYSILFIASDTQIYIY